MKISNFKFHYLIVWHELTVNKSPYNANKSLMLYTVIYRRIAKKKKIIIWNQLACTVIRLKK